MQISGLTANLQKGEAQLCRFAMGAETNVDTARYGNAGGEGSPTPVFVRLYSSTTPEILSLPWMGKGGC